MDFLPIARLDSASEIYAIGSGIIRSGVFFYFKVVNFSNSEVEA